MECCFGPGALLHDCILVEMLPPADGHVHRASGQRRRHVLDPRGQRSRQWQASGHLSSRWQRTSNSAAASGGRTVRRRVVLAALTALAVLASGRLVVACPFCTALAPSLSQLREQAAVVALAEVDVDGGRQAIDRAAAQNHEGCRAPRRQGNAGRHARPGRRAGSSGDPVRNSRRRRARQRADLACGGRQRNQLRVFRPRAVAEDAGGRAACAISDPTWSIATRSWPKTPTWNLAMRRLTRWRTWPTSCRLNDCASGLSIRACRQPARVFTAWQSGCARRATKRGATADFLRGLVVAPEDDFRAGFDGILGGYLLLAGRPGLDLIESRYLANPQAADGDVRHAMTALRFYHEYGREIPAARLGQSLARLLARSEFRRRGDHRPGPLEVLGRAAAGRCRLRARHQRRAIAARGRRLSAGLSGRQGAGGAGPSARSRSRRRRRGRAGALENVERAGQRRITSAIWRQRYVRPFTGRSRCIVVQILQAQASQPTAARRFFGG